MNQDDDKGDADPEFTNDERADWGEAALRRHQNEAEESDDDPGSVSYLIRDLMHLCDRYGWDIPKIIDHAWFLWRIQTGKADESERPPHPGQHNYMLVVRPN